MQVFNCTRCGGTGFLNLEQVNYLTRKRFEATGDHQVIIEWIATNESHDVSVCDCCGNGETWYGQPGEHDWENDDDPKGCR